MDTDTGQDGQMTGPETTAPAGRRLMSAEEVAQRCDSHERWRESAGGTGSRFVATRYEDFSGADFSGRDLTGATFVRAVLRRARFDEATLRGLRLRDADLTDARLDGAQLQSVQLSLAQLERVVAPDADLSLADCYAANLRQAMLYQANLTEAVFLLADLTGADLRLANLKGAEVTRARLIGVKGLFGVDRASNLADVKGAEHAVHCGRYRPWKWLQNTWIGRVCAKQWPLGVTLQPSWAVLNLIGTIHLFSASYASMLVIVLYATAMRWHNIHIHRWHEWSVLHAGDEGAAGVFARFVGLIPVLPVQWHFGLLMISILLLAIGATVFSICCPEPVKEHTETSWTRSLGQPLIEYRSASYHNPWARWITAVCFVTGGLYTLGYLVFRVFLSLRFLLS